MTVENTTLRITFSVQNLDEELHVRNLSGQESLSGLYGFEVEFACESEELDFDQIVGQEACLTLHGPTAPRYVHGIVPLLVKRGRQTWGMIYRATLVPRVHQLTLKTDCRIFQDKSMKQIVTELLDDADIKHMFHSAGGTEPEPREYCVQYRESIWGFISRLLAGEGYSYYFEHLKDKHVLHMSNDPAHLPPIPGGDDAPVSYHEYEATHAAGEHVSELHFTQQIRSSLVTLRDYNFEKPKLDLESSAPKEPEQPVLEVYDYPGGYSDPKVGDGAAALRLEQARARVIQGSGKAFCPRFCAGHRFTLGEYPYQEADDNHQYTLLSVSHSATKQDDSPSGGFTYGNSFTCIPRSTPFRPISPGRPTIQGVQTAIVVGPDKNSSEEIYTEEHGRVKVLFHWDRLSLQDKKGHKYGSCWIRVSQHWAGPAMGALFTPRVGDEVIVEFLEGNPDRPIITGRVYHGTNRTPCTLPKNKTQSTIKTATSPGGVKTGFNEIRFEDKKGSEEIFTHAQKDQNEVVENCMSTSVGVDQSLTVGQDRTKTVKRNETITVKENRDQNVGQNETVTIGQNRDMTVGQNETLTVGAKRDKNVGQDESITVGSKRTLTVGADQEVSIGAKHKVTVGASQDVSVGSNLNEKVGGNASLTVTKKLGQSADEITIKGAKKITAIGNQEVAISGAKVSISATKEIKIGVGPNVITINAQGVEIGGAKITSAAMGIHEISGAMVKIN